MKWLLHGILFVLCLSLSPLAFSQEEPSSESSGPDLIDNSIENLQKVEQTLKQYGTLIPKLQQQIEDSQSLLIASEANSAMLQQQIKDSQGDLETQTRQLQLLTATSNKLREDLAAQGLLLAKYQERVETLSKRYGKLLRISADLKKSLEVSQNVIVILGSVTAAAVLTTIIVLVARK
jgi:septal ring factor EnvC (AmiA/AmiB activator)